LSTVPHARAQASRQVAKKKRARPAEVQVCRLSWWADSICKPPAALVEVQEALSHLELDANLVTALAEFENKRQYKSIFHQELIIIPEFEWLVKVMLP